MARKSPKDTAAVRDSMKSIIRESDDQIIRRLQREAIEGIRRLNNEGPIPQAPYELWPGENYDLGGWALASARKKKSQSSGGLA